MSTMGNISNQNDMEHLFFLHNV